MKLSKISIFLFLSFIYVQALDIKTNKDLSEEKIKFNKYLTGLKNIKNVESSKISEKIKNSLLNIEDLIKKSKKDNIQDFSNNYFKALK